MRLILVSTVVGLWAMIAGLIPVLAWVDRHFPHYGVEIFVTLPIMALVSLVVYIVVTSYS